jgi:simple sugar transport system substrate-binding protein
MEEVADMARTLSRPSAFEVHTMRSPNGSRPRGILTLIAAFALIVGACGPTATGTASTAPQPSASTAAQPSATTAAQPSQSGVDEAAAPFVATFEGGEFRLNEATAAKVRSGDGKFRFVMVGFATSAPFYTPIRKGLDAAAAEFGVSAELIGPAGFEAEQQATDLESVLRTDVDGILLQCPVADLLVPLIDRAFDAGIPIVTYNADCPNSKRFAWTGQLLREAGRTAGEEFLTSFRKVHPAGSAKYQVALMSGAPAAEFARERIAGFSEVVGAEADIELVGPIETSFDPAEGYTAVENAFRGNPELDGVFVADESVLAVGEYVDRNGLKDTVVVVGFNLGAGIPELIEKGSIRASLGQFPYDQGYKSVEVVYDFLTKGEMPSCTVCDLGANVITVDNIGEFIASPDRDKEG